MWYQQVKTVKACDLGRLVWAKLHGFRPYPAIVVCNDMVGMPAVENNSAWVLWLCENRVTQLKVSHLYDFMDEFAKFYASKISKNLYKQAVIEGIKEIYRRDLQPSNVDPNSLSSLTSWAANGFEGADSYKYSADNKNFSPGMLKVLQRLGKRYTQNKSTNSTMSSIDHYDSPINGEDNQTWKAKSALLRTGASLEIHCISCNNEDTVSRNHPYLVGGVCTTCKDELEENCVTLWNYISVHCTICTTEDEMVICDNPKCERIFCLRCIELLVSFSAILKLEDIDMWKCRICFDKQNVGMLIPWPGWENTKDITPFSNESDGYTSDESIDNVEADKDYILPDDYSSSEEYTNCNKFRRGHPCFEGNTRKKSSYISTSIVEDDAPPVEKYLPKRPIRVLSLFDGIGTGLLCLQKLGIQVEKYFSSEIDQDCHNVVTLNFGGKVEQVGDIENLSEKKIFELLPIDLVIGGSPCNDLANVNYNQKGLFDLDGTGILFFQYYRVLKTIQLHQARFYKNHHVFWLFENVKGMRTVYKNYISMFFERPPAPDTSTDAKYFSPQRRPRCFWGNIPGMYDPVKNTKYQKHNLQQYLAKLIKKFINNYTTEIVIPTIMRIQGGGSVYYWS
ncbi:unnamed protein product, partial [Meganyctiphanes norvegica]